MQLVRTLPVTLAVVMSVVQKAAAALFVTVRRLAEEEQRQLEEVGSCYRSRALQVIAVFKE